MCFQPPSSLIEKVMALVMPSLCGTHPTECFGDGAIDVSAAFDRVNYERIQFKLCSVGVGGSVLSVLTQYLANR